MSVHSIDHIDDTVSDRAYKGYHIDNAGEVTEFYDHRDAEPPPESSIATSSYHQPLVTSNGHNPLPSKSKRPPPRRQKRKHKDAGCCNGCVSLLTTIGTMPFATGFGFLCSWLGTGLFIGGAWKAMDETLVLFQRYGPNVGNPATDPAPQYVYTGDTGSFSSNYILLNDNDLGNRVPQVFESLKYSFYAIIPFMIFFTIILACDNRFSSRSLGSKKGSFKTSSTGICFTAGLIVCTYLLLLLWIFFLAFTTLGVYYYRVVMTRCFDLNDRGFSEGVLSSICLDLVQFGLVMFQDTTDAGFGKICGPGDNMRSFGRLQDYCENYYPAYEFMLMAFSGCLLIIIALLNFIMILTGNYNALTRKLHNKSKEQVASIASSYPHATAATTTYRESPMTYRSAPTSTVGSQPLLVVGTSDRQHPSDVDYRSRRSSRDLDADHRLRRSSRDLDVDYRPKRYSKDMELDYMLDGESSIAPRRGEMDSNAGVNYYYKGMR